MSRKEIIVIGSIVSLLLLAAIIPRLVPPQNVAAKESCIALLKQIDGATHQWALDHQGTNASPSWREDMNTNAVPTWEDLRPYLKHIPVCPSGGSYTLGAAPEGAQCSLFRHSLELGLIYVTDDKGTALPEALVAVFEGRKQWDTYRTDSEGKIRVDVYWKGEMATKVTAGKEGFQEASSSVEAKWPIRFKLQKK